MLLAFILAGFLAVVLLMGAILAPLFTGIVLAYVLQGVVKQLVRYKVPDLVAVMVTFLVFLGGFVAFLVLVIPRVWRQMRNLFEELPALMTQVRETLNALPAAYPDFVSEQQVHSWGELLNAEVGEIGQWILSVSLSQLPVVITVFVYMMLVPILVFFLLKDKDQLLDWCLGFLPRKRPLMNKIGKEMDQQMSNYIRGKFTEFLIVGLVTYVLFLTFGLNYSALLAFLVGLSVIVPYLGVAVVTVPVTLIAYLQFGWSAEFMYLVGGYALVQAIDGMLLVPLLFSEANNLHPLAIILAVVIFGSWWGIWGVFFAIPLATLLKALIAAWPTPGTSA